MHSTGTSLSDKLELYSFAFAQDGATVGVFKLASNGEAVRMPVHFGRSSVNTIEILDGLKEGDQVILSDTSAYDSHDRIRLN